VHKAHVNRSPILEIFNFRVFATRLNPTIFRVSRVSLDSINRLVNIEKHALNFVEEFMALKEAIFWVYTFPFVLFYEDD
jgi:hypothetical protein